MPDYEQEKIHALKMIAECLNGIQMDLKERERERTLRREREREREATGAPNVVPPRSPESGAPSSDENESGAPPLRKLPCGYVCKSSIEYEVLRSLYEQRLAAHRYAKLASAAVKECQRRGYRWQRGRTLYKVLKDLALPYKWYEEVLWR